MKQCAEQIFTWFCVIVQALQEGWLSIYMVFCAICFVHCCKTLQYLLTIALITHDQASFQGFFYGICDQQRKM